MSRSGRIRAFFLQYCLPRQMRRTIDQVLSRNLTYLPRARLIALALLCRRMERGCIPGVMVEAGCALGGSSIVLAKAKERGRRLCIYDVFGMIPAPDDQDGKDSHARYEVIREGHASGIGGEAYYGYQEDLYETVRGNLRRFGCLTGDDDITLVKGDVQQTLALNDPVCLAHVDVDWYKPVRTCIERVVPRLSQGGAIVFDDYLEWSGCRKAVDEYFERCSAPGFSYDVSFGSLIIKKKRSDPG